MQPNSGPEDTSNWNFRTEDQAVPDPQTNNPYSLPKQESEPITWTASEFIDHHKSPAWYGVVIGTFIALSAILYITIKDIIAIIAIGIAVVLFLVMASKKPRQLPYQVDDHGITIGNKFYAYSEFKSFALRREGVIGSISFTPLKRLMPEISIYYTPEDESRIVALLSERLPNDQRREGGTNAIMNKIRF